MNRRRTFRSLTRVVTATALIVGAAVAGIALSPGEGRVVQAQAGGQFGAGGEYHAITPTRILDTRERSLDVEPFGKKPTSTEETGDTFFNVPIVGAGGLPEFVDNDSDGVDDNVLAVAVNVTVVEPTSVGWLRAFGKGASEGTTSVVNFEGGQVVPNNAVLRPGEDGELSIRVATPTAAGSAHVIIDVFGWFSSSNHDENGARMVPVTPGRVYDSRESLGDAQVGPASSTAIQIRGADAFDPAQADIVPGSDDVVGVMINITGVNVYSSSRPTFFAALPTPASGVPDTSNLNLQPGDVRASTAIVPVGDDGRIHIYNLDGQADLIVDVVAYLIDGQDPDTRQGRVVPLVAPFRAFDTREADFGDQPLGPARAEDWSFESFANDVKIGPDAVGEQLGLIGNLTATGLDRQYSWVPAVSYLTAFPTPADGQAVPTVSNINISEGATVPNMTLLKYGERDGEPNQVRFYNLAGYLDYLVDVSAVILAD